MLNRESQKVEARFPRTPEISKISAIIEDPDGRLWLGGHYGLFRWDGQTLEKFTEHPLLEGANIETLAIDRHGALYAGTAGGRPLVSHLGRFGER